MAASSETTLLARSASEYWSASRQPLASLLFILPLLIVYEVGVWMLGPPALNGAAVWLGQGLQSFGIGGSLLLPLIVIAILLAWHHTTGKNWRVSAGVLYLMVAECFLLAAALIVLAQLPMALMPKEVATIDAVPVCGLVSGHVLESYLNRIVSYSGAGIYEEVLFRLMMIPVAIYLFRCVGFSLRAQVLASIIVTSVVFSFAHHIGSAGEPFVVYRFTFRCMAGAFFAALFIHRGFGIAAGTHALYDILVGMNS